MKTANVKYRSARLKSHFVRSHDETRTPANHKPAASSSNEKSRNGRESLKRSSHRISKVRDSNKDQSQSSILADDLAASLDQYRESIHTSVVKDLENVEKALVTGLEELTVDLDHHFDDLANIEEPLQKPFDTETLSIQPKPGPKQQAQEVLLQDRITAFRKLREEKEKILCKLWEDWEDIQFRLIGLAAEVLGQDTLAFAQVRDEDMKPGQREKLENALEAAQKIFDANGDPHDSLAQDLEAFEENVGQIASKTKSTVSELQQQYNVQKNKLFKGLHRHIELLAAL